MVQAKKEEPCADCGVSYPYYVMDFDHVSGEKVMMISQLVLRGATTKLMTELEKCEVVCANCHRIRTFERLQATKPWLDRPEPPTVVQQSLF
jgi:L-lysine 2,3-aminomutase